MSTNIPLPSNLQTLEPTRKRILSEILRMLESFEDVYAIILGGSTCGSNPRSDGDIDIWLYVKDKCVTAKLIKDNLDKIPLFQHVIDAGYLPWFGKLTTCYFFSDCCFSIDLGCCEIEDAHTINTGPGFKVLWSDAQTEEFIKIATEKRRFIKPTTQRADTILSNILKLRKALDRNDLFGALEYLARGRRELFGIIRDKCNSASDWYERPDRDSSSYLSEGLRTRLSLTVSTLDEKDLKRAASELIKITLDVVGTSIPSSLLTLLTTLTKEFGKKQTEANTVVGFVGAGRMGSAIITKLIESGVDVMASETDPTRISAIQGLGAKVVDVEEIAVSAKVIFLALPQPEITTQVILSCLATAPPGLVFIDLSTNGVSDSRRLESFCTSEGHAYLDAPMSGGIWAARDGNLTLMIGGKETVFELIKPLLSIFAEEIIYVGDSGAGSSAKLIHNMVGELQVQGFAEAFCIAKRLGLNLNKIFKCLGGGMASSRILTHLYMNGVLSGNTVNVPISIAEKDQRLLIELCAENGIDPTWTFEVHRRLVEMQSQGKGSLDVTQTICWFAQKHNISIDNISEIGLSLQE